jgi:hypothetical protein
MSESNLPIIDIAVAQLFRASHYSLDPATSDFMLQRTVPITIYIDGNYDGLADLAAVLKDDAARIMTEFGYPQVGEWGPFEGSYLTTIFGRKEEPELGWSLLKSLPELSERLLVLKNRIPQEAWSSIRAVMIVGTLVVHLIGAGALAAALPVAVPIVVIEYVALAVEAGESIEAIRHVLRLGPIFSRGKPGKFDL